MCVAVLCSSCKVLKPQKEMPREAEILELLILTVCLIMTVLARLNGFHAGLYLNATITLTPTLSQKSNGKVRSSRNAKLRKTHLQEFVRETFFAPKNSMVHVRCEDYIRKRDEIKITGLWSVFRSERMCATVFPATPTFVDPQLQPPDVACIFPEMRYEDSRVGSFSGEQNDRVNHSALRLAGNGYYYDDIYQDIRCFYCGLTYDGHLPHCRERRERCNVPFRHCWRHREQLVHRDDNLFAIISSPGFVLRGQEASRELTRETQQRQAVGLISGQCPSCSRNLSSDVVFSCNHRARMCERCSRLQDACPYCGQGSSDNPTMAEYNRRTTLLVPRDPRICLVCRDTRASILLMPCNHIAVCAPCSRTIRSCPRCFSNIEHVVETSESL